MTITVNNKPLDEYLGKVESTRKTSEIADTLNEDKRKCLYKQPRNTFNKTDEGERSGRIKKYNEFEIRRYEFMSDKSTPIPEVSVKQVLVEMMVYWEDVLRIMDNTGMLKKGDDRRVCVPTCAKYLNERFPDDTRFLGKNMGVSMSVVYNLLEKYDIMQREKSSHNSYAYTLEDRFYTLEKEEIWKMLSVRKYKTVDTANIIPGYTPIPAVPAKDVPSNTRKKVKETIAVKSKKKSSKLPVTDSLNINQLMEVIVQNSPPTTTIEINTVGHAAVIKIVIGGATVDKKGK